MLLICDNRIISDGDRLEELTNSSLTSNNQKLSLTICKSSMHVTHEHSQVLSTNRVGVCVCVCAVVCVCVNQIDGRYMMSDLQSRLRLQRTPSQDETRSITPLYSQLCVISSLD